METTRDGLQWLANIWKSSLFPAPIWILGFSSCKWSINRNVFRECRLSFLCLGTPIAFILWRLWEVCTPSHSIWTSIRVERFLDWTFWLASISSHHSIHVFLHDIFGDVLMVWLTLTLNDLDLILWLFLFNSLRRCTSHYVGLLLLNMDGLALILLDHGQIRLCSRLWIVLDTWL